MRTQPLPNTDRKAPKKSVSLSLFPGFPDTSNGEPRAMKQHRMKTKPAPTNKPRPMGLLY